MKSPVALFCYNRKDLLCQTLSALSENPESHDTILYIFSDGSKSQFDKPAVQQVRTVLNNIEGFYKVYVVLRESNLGLSENIIAGVSEVLKQHDSVIVLEDDIKVSKCFLAFMNQALQRYKSDFALWHISGWNYPVDLSDLADMFFWRVMNCWGWATWADRWRYFKKNPEDIVMNFTTEQIYGFNLDGCHDFWGQVLANYQGKLNTWAIFWYTTIFQHDGLCLNPAQTLVDNIGFGDAGTHCRAEKSQKDILSLKAPKDWPEIFEESSSHCDRIKYFLLSKNSAIPVDLTKVPLTGSEKSDLVNLLVLQNYNLNNSLEQIWHLMDLIWDQYGLNNQELNHTLLQKFYSHPVWLLNGLFTESDSTSIRHRELLANWINNNSCIKSVVDIGGGIGFLARIVTSFNPGLKADVLEPFPSEFAKRIVSKNPQVDFISELTAVYDCIILMDVLEHVEDPVGKVYSMLANIREQGYLVVANCFRPVIKCHLPKTFHLNYSFAEIMDALGFDYIECLAGTHIEIFRKVHTTDLATARERERLSCSFYKNILNDSIVLDQDNAALHLNYLLSKFYKRLDEIISSDEKYIIYGAGTGARLLIQAMKNNIRFLVDKNQNVWTETRFGKKIYPPERLQSSTEKILVSVFGREKEINDYLLNSLQISPDRIVEISL